jgi:hypothetical protein
MGEVPVVPYAPSGTPALGDAVNPYLAGSPALARIRMSGEDRLAMANHSDSNNTIEALLEQRAQFEQWLAKLDAAANNAPAAVRQKVRGDYEARLRGVIERLRGHSATIAGELERYQSSHTELDGQRRSAEDELAEAQVRHAVGEYTEEEWQRISHDSESRLQGLRDQLRGVGNEIARLAEVQSLIGAPSRPAEQPVAPPMPPAQAAADIIEKSPPPPPPPVDDGPVEEPPQPAARSTPSKPAPRPREPEPQPAAPVDELAFLKSVADDEIKPAPRRPSNPGGSAPATAPAHVASRAVDAPPAPSGKAAGPGVAKTLKCGECGTLNRPTEWYCERCGAELAGV